MAKHSLSSAGSLKCSPAHRHRSRSRSSGDRCRARRTFFCAKEGTAGRHQMARMTSKQLTDGFKTFGAFSRSTSLHGPSVGAHSEVSVGRKEVVKTEFIPLWTPNESHAQIRPIRLTFFFFLFISHVGPAYRTCVRVCVAAARVEFQERAA